MMYQLTFLTLFTCLDRDSISYVTCCIYNNISSRGHVSFCAYPKLYIQPLLIIYVLFARMFRLNLSALTLEEALKQLNLLV